VRPIAALVKVTNKEQLYMPDRAELPPTFDHVFRCELESLFAWRRDVRRFRSMPVAEELVDELVRATRWAPSVGYSQPSRFVRVDSTERRTQIIAEFERSNLESANLYQGEAHEHYRQLKLAGLREAPIHLAVFCDVETTKGKGLGRHTMPETLPYSVVMAIYTLWLLARTHGVGVGWVSIFNPQTVNDILETPEGWMFVAYLCIGYPEEEHEDPELLRAGWETRSHEAVAILQR
jgi:5,6-dimethylbenzimidazole synthase